MNRTDNQALKTQGVTSIQDVYDQYAGMLYGYLVGVLNDKEQASKYLESIFDEIAQTVDEKGNCGPYTWCGLYRMAKSKLIKPVDHENGADNQEAMVYALGNSMYNELSAEQKQVFYETYYRGKLVSQLAAQWNRSEESIKKILNEAFNILRKGEN